MIRLDVRNSRELQAQLLAIKRAPNEIAKQIRNQTQAVAPGIWKKAVAEEASTKLEALVLANSATTTVSDKTVRLMAGTKGKVGKTKNAVLAKAVEFGSGREKYKTYQGRRGTKRFEVKRRTARQFRPMNRKGYVVYPAAARVIPRIAALWVQTTVRTLHESFEGKRG